MIAHKLLSNRQNKWTVAVIITGIALFAVVLWAWWHFIRSDVDRTFYAALDNSFRTMNATRQVAQAGLGQTLDQTVDMSLGANRVTHGLTTISSEGETNSTVRTETVGTPFADYVRYTAIETTDENAPDFADVLNVWSKTDSPDKSQTTGELYGESALGIVPLGNLSAAQRAALLKFIKDKKVYQFDQKAVKQELSHGRPVYTYKVTVSPEGWLGMLKQFAHDVGLTQLENIDPAVYRETQPIELGITVDVWSRQITQVSYGEERQERLGGYGIQRDITVPKESISVEELQQRLQKTE